MDPGKTDVLESITKFVHWLAWKSADPSTPLMEYDEVVGELLYEVAKGLDRYGDLPHVQQLAVIRRMCDNRLAELRYRYYVTHRKEARLTLDISIMDDDDQPDADYQYPLAATVEAVSGSMFRVAETRRRLSPTTQAVFDAAIYPNSRMATQILLSGMRSAAVYVGGGTVKVRPHHVAEALCITETAARKAFAEIRKVYGKVRQEYG